MSTPIPRCEHPIHLLAKGWHKGPQWQMDIEMSTPISHCEHPIHLLAQALA